MGTDSLRNTKVSQFGYGFYVAWFFCAWFAPGLFPSGMVGPEHTLGYYLVFTATTALTSLSIPLLDKLNLAHDPIKSFTFSGIVFIACTVGMPLLVAGGAPDVALFICSACLGISFALQNLVCGNVGALWEIDTVELIYPLSSFLAPLALFIAGNMNAYGSTIIIILLAVIPFLMTRACLKDESQSSLPPIRPLDQSTQFWRDHLRIGLGSCAIFATVGCVWVFKPSLFISTQTFTPSTPLIAGLIIAEVAVLLSIQFSSRNNLFSIYRWTLPLNVIALCLLCLSGTTSSVLGATILCVSMQMFYTMIDLFTVRVAKNRWRSASTCIGMNRGFIYLGLWIGALAASLYNMSSGNRSPLYIYLLLICFVTVACTFVLNRQTRYERRSTLDSDVPYGRTTDLGTEAHSRTRADVSLADMPIPESDVSHQAEKLGHDPFEEASRAVAERAGLSARETEVFMLLARGRTVTFIRDYLFISKNTVNTHTRRIYHKLNIHSRSELLDLIDKEQIRQRR